MSKKIVLPILILITLVVYFKSLNNKFTNWDDDFYVTENQDIRTLNGDSIAYTLQNTFKTYVVGNYHPLTMLTYCLEYEKFKLDPKPYHLTNLILHILNTLLVFGFIWLLTKQQWTAFFVSLLFAIHPMHVESVSWVSERKDVLYSFFYLSGLCTYILYLKKEKIAWIFYVLTFLLFGLAVLSKAMAVSLPIAFFVIDYFLDRKISLKILFEKLPFIIVSVIVGYVAIIAQKESHALEGLIYYSFFDRVLFISYGIIIYLWKLLLPLNLSCFYSYPVKENGWYPILFYVAPILLSGLIYLVYRSKQYGKDVLFGFGFFFITIVLVIQIIPVGGALMADRYTYLPYIGLFFIIARWINKMIENKPKYLPIFIVLFILIVAALSFQSFQRTKVWHDSISLWSDAIKKNNKEDVLYKLRGLAYTNEKKYDKAIQDFDRAIELRPKNPDVFYDRGVAYNHKGNFQEAIRDYSASIYYLDLINDSTPSNRYRLKYEKAYNNRGTAYGYVGKLDQAIDDFTAAIKNDSTFADAYNNRGMTYRQLGKYKEAINDFNKAIHYSPKYKNAYCNLGVTYKSLRRLDEALENFNSAILIDPKYSVAYYHRGFTYYYLGKYEQAVKDYTAAISNDTLFIQAYFNRGIANYAFKKYDASINDYSFVINKKPNYGLAYYNRGLAFETIGKYDKALNDILESKRFGCDVDPAYIESLRSKSKKLKR